MVKYAVSAWTSPIFMFRALKQTLSINCYSEKAVTERSKNTFKISQEKYMQASQGIYMTISRTLSFLASLLVLYYEYCGSNKSDSLLLGHNDETILGNVYKCQLISLLVASIVQDPSTILKSLSSLTTPNGSSVVFLDLPNTSSNSFSLQVASCIDLLDVDFLYDPDFLQTIVEQTLYNYDLNIGNSWLVVDCTFDGRLLEDTSMLKIFLLDREMVNMTTIVIQTVSINRLKHHRTSIGGAAMFTTTTVASLHLATDSSTIHFSSPASYFFAIGFDFPFEATPFERIIVDNLIALEGQWRGTVVTTNERFTFGGIEGFYRGALRIQSVFGYYYWDLPVDPIQYMATTQYYFHKYLHDSWGWFRCLLGIGILTSLSMSTLVSLLVMRNLYFEKKVVWIPDIYPAIQRLAMYRALLLFVDCWIDSWWRVYQIAMNQGLYRLQLTGPPSLDAITLVDGLMVCLGVTYLAAKTLRVRVHLVVVLAVYLFCFKYRFDIVNYMGIRIEETNEYLYECYGKYLVVSENSLSLWTVYETTEISALLILTETTWLLVALATDLVYIFAVFLHSRRHLIRVRQSFLPVAPDSSFRSFSNNISTHWSKRSLLYEPLQSQDNDYTSFERSVGAIVGYVFGFVASTIDYEEIDSRVFVSRNGVWLLGYIVLDGEFAIEIDVFPLFLLNVLIQSSIFQVYGHIIQRKGISSHLHKIPWDEFDMNRALLSVSLVPLP